MRRRWTDREVGKGIEESRCAPLMAVVLHAARALPVLLLELLELLLLLVCCWMT